MKRIKDIAKCPSEALQAMIDGLLEQDAREDFQITMHSYGTSNKSMKLCFGCAATCTLQKLAGKNLNIDTINSENSRAKALGFDVDDLNYFECVINDARVGSLMALFLYYYGGPDGEEAITAMKIPRAILYNDVHLASNAWKSKIPIVQNLIVELQKLGY